MNNFTSFNITDYCMERLHILIYHNAHFINFVLKFKYWDVLHIKIAIGVNITFQINMISKSFKI